MLTPKERLVRQARGQEVDRVPCLGGWIGGARILAALAGIGIGDYLKNPFAGAVRANKALGVDGMVSPVAPKDVEQIRTGYLLESKFDGVEPEALLEAAEKIPDSEKEVLATFDRQRNEKELREHFQNAFRDWDGIVPIPNFWDIGGHFPLYHQFGYIAFLQACALYPEAVGKIWWSRSLHSRERAKILVGLFREYDLVPLMFCGEDVCNNQGPMVSPAFLRKHYFPTVQMSIAPLVESGIRLIHHCDGDVRPVVGDFVAIGFSGFQGFQYEVGVDPYELKKLRGPRGEEPLFFAGLSVTRTLPFGTPDDVRAEVDYFLDFTDGGRGVFLFTSNVTGVEVPPENIRAAYEHVKTWPAGKRRPAPRRRWPWFDSHPND